MTKQKDVAGGITFGPNRGRLVEKASGDERIQRILLDW